MERVNRSIIDEIRQMAVSAPTEPIPERVDAWKELEAAKKAGIPKRYYRATFKELEKKGCPADVRPMAKEACLYAKRLKENSKEGKGVMFFGAVGRMKTTLACCIAREAMRQGMGAFFISMPELMDKLVSMSKGDGTEFRRFEEKVKHTRFLILDDFGAEYPAGWVLNKVDAIITSRYNDMLPTIITTNMLPSEISERYVQRVFDRLRSTSLIIGMYGNSLRKDTN